MVDKNCDQRKTILNISNQSKSADVCKPQSPKERSWKTTICLGRARRMGSKICTQEAMGQGAISSDDQRGAYGPIV